MLLGQLQVLIFILDFLSVHDVCVFMCVWVRTCQGICVEVEGQQRFEAGKLGYLARVFCDSPVPPLLLL